MTYKPPTIADAGLRDWLDNSMSKHNNYGYESFKNMVTYGVSKAEMARKFGVDRLTIDSWIGHYDEGHIQPQV